MRPKPDLKLLAQCLKKKSMRKHSKKLKQKSRGSEPSTRLIYRTHWTSSIILTLWTLDIILEGSIFCMVDVSALYTNSNMEDIMVAVKRALDLRENQIVPTDFIGKLVHYAPNVADLFMTEIDRKILDPVARTDSNFPISFYLRFLDDIFMLYTGSSQDLHQFLREINTIPIKFTMSHTTPATPNFDCEAADSIPFLDTSIKISGQLVMDLYRKPTDWNQYLLPSSCHPAPCTKNIPTPWL